MTISKSWEPASGTQLCLNGHTIRLAEGSSGSVIFINSADFTLTDCQDTPGQVTGGSAEKGGGVYVGSSSNFTMYGGTIVGNTAAEGNAEYTSRGGGVFKNSSGKFNIEN